MSNILLELLSSEKVKNLFILRKYFLVKLQLFFISKIISSTVQFISLQIGPNPSVL